MRGFGLKSSKRGGGGKLSRTETVTVRLDPKLRYLAELAARKQRRTLSSFVEWAIEEILKTIQLPEGENLASMAGALWDVDEPDRFVKLALLYPDMLTHDEQVLWKLITENGYVWRGCRAAKKANGYGRCEGSISSLNVSASIGKYSRWWLMNAGKGRCSQLG